MPTIERIREICARLSHAESGPEFDRVVMELMNALDTYKAIKKDDDKAAEA